MVSQAHHLRAGRQTPQQIEKGTVWTGRRARMRQTRPCARGSTTSGSASGGRQQSGASFSRPCCPSANALLTLCLARSLARDRPRFPSLAQTTPAASHPSSASGTPSHTPLPSLSGVGPSSPETLEVVKFVCKDVWTALYDKQVDNLRTNHRGVYVLLDQSLRSLRALSAPEGKDEERELARWVRAVRLSVLSSFLLDLGSEADPTSTALARSPPLLAVDRSSPFRAASSAAPSRTSACTQPSRASRPAFPKVRLVGSISLARSSIVGELTRVRVYRLDTQLRSRSRRAGQEDCRSCARTILDLSARASSARASERASERELHFLSQ